MTPTGVVGRRQAQLAIVGEEYAKPQPIRVCYPSVQLRDCAVYFCGVSDIVEPNEPDFRTNRKNGRDRGGISVIPASHRGLRPADACGGDLPS